MCGFGVGGEAGAGLQTRWGVVCARTRCESATPTQPLPQRATGASLPRDLSANGTVSKPRDPASLTGLDGVLGHAHLDVDGVGAAGAAVCVRGGGERRRARCHHKSVRQRAISSHLRACCAQAAWTQGAGACAFSSLKNAVWQGLMQRSARLEENARRGAARASGASKRAAPRGGQQHHPTQTDTHAKRAALRVATRASMMMQRTCQ